ncbi:MAG: pre-16S rRNA-processing nuclease YqgF [Candidatus Eremiobacteraeota bacterium]|nr:pre-16S rRNA-processing nuclease YqgF [Candidatus Eremiobacteraeota bacterium]MBV9055744.1 pre-16S rRNA-processing nuclease YqgF [Candidatus Eremiobacteraeota bacterium]MBV9699170.1 pre-16S rRNA-processing nuclease YqgF [Candidatus Eremiobacteraeota bacterium]
MSAVIGVDPGRAKAGYALVESGGNVLLSGIEQLEQLPARLRQVVAGTDARAIALGRGTNARAVLPMLEALGLPVHLVDERETTRFARRLYFEDHPPKGWRRFIPVGLQLPARPIDDYAAILIARRFLARGAEAGPPS